MMTEYTHIIPASLEGVIVYTSIPSPHRCFLQIKGIVIPGRGVAVSGQHQNTELTQGMDQGEGINGWFTLFQMSAKPLGSFAEAETKAKLASQCSADMEGDLISWTTTPRKGYGGITETPSYSKACGRF